VTLFAEKGRFKRAELLWRWVSFCIYLFDFDFDLLWVYRCM
jgi:hypothetical protein